ncbi:nicotinate-nucleotide adenylyltransferase, partial [Streptococcus suis]
MAIELLTPFTKVELDVEKKETNRKQVGILGGNLNPDHNSHLIVSDKFRQQLKMYEV